MTIRPAAVAGSWYPANATALSRQVQSYLDQLETEAEFSSPDLNADVVALVAPHAGLTYSGLVAAHAYRLLSTRSYDNIVLVGPSHYVAFDGAAIWPAGAFETPLGAVSIDENLSADIAGACQAVHERPAAHQREHSLEMQLPFVARLAPTTPVVPIVMGLQTRATAIALGDAIAHATRGQRTLLIASSDLSHFYDAATAAELDAKVMARVGDLDDEGLMTLLEHRPDHACGGGPMVSVLRAARLLGARSSRVLCHADSGDVSGDKSSVVGYLAAAAWR